MFIQDAKINIINLSKLDLLKVINIFSQIKYEDSKIDVFIEKAIIKQIKAFDEQELVKIFNLLSRKKIIKLKTIKNIFEMILNNYQKLQIESVIKIIYNYLKIDQNYQFSIDFIENITE